MSRTKWGSIVENCGKNAIFKCQSQTFRTKWGSIVKNWGNIAINILRDNPFARNEVWSSKPEAKLILGGNRFARNEVWSSKTEMRLWISNFGCNPFPFVRSSAGKSLVPVFQYEVVLRRTLCKRCRTNQCWQVFCANFAAEGNLKVRLPMEKSKNRGGKSQGGEFKKWEDQRRERVRSKKMQVRENVGKSRLTVFSNVGAPAGRKVTSLKRWVGSQLARWEMKNCMPLWRKTNFQVKM